MKIITLTNSDSLVLVDDIDYEYLVQYNWQVNKAKHKGESIRRCETRNSINVTYYIARVIAEMHGLNIEGKEIDHINRDIFDNRLENLRVATSSQNNANTGLKISNTSGFKGVYYDHKNDRWKAQINVQRKKYHLGYFNTPEEAARMYDRAARSWFKDFAVTNFPVTDSEVV